MSISTIKICVCHSYFHVRYLFSLHSGHPSQSVDFGVSDHGNIPEFDGLCAQTHVAVQESCHLTNFVSEFGLLLWLLPIKPGLIGGLRAVRASGPTIQYIVYDSNIVCIR